MNMKKKYTYPQVIVMPCYGVSTLCTSGEISTNLNISTSDTGEHPWTGGRAPRRTRVF